MMDNIIRKSSISTHLSLKMIDTATKKAKETGINISVHIVDESGVMKAFTRMDNAPLISVDAARKKAITAIGFGLPTGETWYNFIKDDPIMLHGANNFTDFILLGGGSPIILEDQLVGAIGISGGHYKQDEECMRAALETIKQI